CLRSCSVSCPVLCYVTPSTHQSSFPFASMLAVGVVFLIFSLRNRPPPRATLFPYTTLFRSEGRLCAGHLAEDLEVELLVEAGERSEEHTSELQSRVDLVCPLLLEKKNRPSVCC